MATDPKRISALRSIASDISWARTPNRTERTEPARRASPMHIDYHIAKVRAEGLVREEDIQAAAESSHRAHMKQMSMKAAATRRIKAESQRRPSLRRSA